MKKLPKKLIIVTEKKYVQNLRTLKNDYYLPLLELVKNNQMGDITSDIIDGIFKNVETLLTLNSKLLNDLTETYFSNTQSIYLNGSC